MSLHDGVTVSYVGHSFDGVALGDRGRVLSSSGDHAHVMWSTGARVNQVDLVHEDDLVVAGRKAASHTIEASVDDSLVTAPLTTVAVRAIYDGQGEAGLLNALSEAGLLGGLAQIAEDALMHVASRVREDEEISAVLAQLDSDEAESLVSLASVVLLRDAFGSTDD